MKKEYVSPDVLEVKIETYRSLLEVSDGTLDQYEGKEHDDVVEEDGEETSLLEKEAQPLAISNDFLKKVWD